MGVEPALLLLAGEEKREKLTAVFPPFAIIFFLVSCLLFSPMQQLRSASPRGRRPGTAKKAAANSTHIDLSVQDRRHNARVLHETELRKAQLLPLTAPDVARNVQRYFGKPSDILDDRAALAPPLAHAAGPSAQRRNEKEEVVSRKAEKEKKEEEDEDDAGLNSTTKKWVAHFQEMRQASATVSVLNHSGTMKTMEDTTSVDAITSSVSFSSAGAPLNYEDWVQGGCPTCSWALLLGDVFYNPIIAEQATLHALYDKDLPTITTPSVMPEDDSKEEEEEKHSDGSVAGR